MYRSDIKWFKDVFKTDYFGYILFIFYIFTIMPIHYLRDNFKVIIVVNQTTKDKLQKYLETGLARYKGLYDYAGILFHTDEIKMICFQDRDNPFQEIVNFFYDPENALSADVKYLAIYLTPFSK